MDGADFLATDPNLRFPVMQESKEAIRMNPLAMGLTRPDVAQAAARRAVAANPKSMAANVAAAVPGASGRRWAGGGAALGGLYGLLSDPGEEVDETGRVHKKSRIGHMLGSAAKGGLIGGIGGAALRRGVVQPAIDPHVPAAKHDVRAAKDLSAAEAIHNRANVDKATAAAKADAGAARQLRLEAEAAHPSALQRGTQAVTQGALTAGHKAMQGAKAMGGKVMEGARGIASKLAPEPAAAAAPAGLAPKREAPVRNVEPGVPGGPVDPNKRAAYRFDRGVEYGLRVDDVFFKLGAFQGIVDGCPRFAAAEVNPASPDLAEAFFYRKTAAKEAGPVGPLGDLGSWELLEPVSEDQLIKEAEEQAAKVAATQAEEAKAAEAAKALPEGVKVPKLARAK